MLLGKLDSYALNTSDHFTWPPSAAWRGSQRAARASPIMQTTSQPGFPGIPRDSRGSPPDFQQVCTNTTTPSTAQPHPALPRILTPNMTHLDYLSFVLLPGTVNPRPQMSFITQSRRMSSLRKVSALALQERSDTNARCP